MKAFSFRLEQALRWRSTQVDVEKAKTSAAAAALAGTRQELADLQAGLSSAVVHLRSGSSDGSTLASWSAWETRAQGQIRQTQLLERQADAALRAQMETLVEANRKLRLLENLKATRKEKWTLDFARELETFAAESFLGRLQSERKGA